MANDFDIKMGIDAKKAIDTLQELLDKSKQITKEFDSDFKIEIDGREVKETLEEVNEHLVKIQDSTGKVSDGFSKIFDVAKVAGFVGAIIAAYEILKKIYNVVEDTAEEIVSLDNAAQSMFMKTNNLKAWETAFRGMGFEAREADRILGSIADKLIAMRFAPDPDTAAGLAYLGITSTVDAQGNSISPEQLQIQALRNSFKKDGTKRGRPVFNQDYFVGRFEHAFGWDREEATKGYKLGLGFIDQIQANENKTIVTQPQIDASAAKVATNAQLGATTDSVRYATLSVISKTLNTMAPDITSIANSLSLIVNSFAGKVLQHLDKGDLGRAVFGYNLPKANPGTIGKVYNAVKGYADIIGHAALKDMVLKREGGKNIVTTTDKGTKHYGPMQYLLSTFVGYHGNPKKIMESGEQDKVFNNEIADFEKKTGLSAAKNPQQFYMWHNMGETAYRRISQMHGLHTYKDAYSHSPGGLERYKNNKSLMDIPLPTNYYQHAAAVQNNIAHNKQMQISSNMNIGHINVSANNPIKLISEIGKQSNYNEWLSSQIGQLA